MVTFAMVGKASLVAITMRTLPYGNYQAQYHHYRIDYNEFRFVIASWPTHNNLHMRMQLSCKS